MADDLIQRLTEWLRKRGEPDSGIRYERRNPYSGDRSSHVELHGSDADFIAKHFHGQGARDLAAALTRLTAGEPVVTEESIDQHAYRVAHIAVLPCDIHLPPATVLRKGVSLTALLLGLKARGMALPDLAAPPRTYEDGRATHRHKKRGSEYVLIGFGNIQTSVWSEPIPLSRLGINKSVDMNEVAIYRSVDDGSLWVRPREEFEDGRFEALLVSP